MSIDHAGAERLAERFGDSYYLYDRTAFEGNARDFLGAFTKIYPRSRLAYSYKTNYIPALCRQMDQWGAYAEVVSILEYDLARRIGVEPENIVFNGPYKSEADLERSLVAGSTVNLDSFYEVPLVEKIADRHPGSSLKVGLRCSFDVGNDAPSRFGFDVAGDDFAEALDRLRSRSNIVLRGLHCHFLPPGRSAEAYGRIARRMVALAEKHFPGAPPEFLDVGGGFFSRMSPEMRRQFSDDVPDFDDYGEAIARPFAEAYGESEGPELILEPGLAVVADVMRFVCRVLDVKRADGRPTALLAGSVYNVRPTKSPRNLPVTRLARPGDSGRRARGPLDLVGYTCMEDDILHRGYEGEVAAGDFMVFDNVGAYTVVLKPPFILPSPPVISIARGDQPETVLRRAETLDDVFASYTLDEAPGGSAHSTSHSGSRSKAGSKPGSQDG